MTHVTVNELSKVLTEMCKLQDAVLAFYNDSDANSAFLKFESFLTEQKTLESKTNFTTFVSLLLEIINNFNRCSSFTEKNRKLIQKLKPYFTKYYENLDCFNLVKNNKLFLLLLFQEKIIIPNDQINSIVQSYYFKMKNYPEYFFNEFKKFNNEETNQKILKNLTKSEESQSLPSDFEDKRIIGENDNAICAYIRNNDLDQFVNFINQNNFDLNLKIENSIYETHPFLMENDFNIIEYALFFGSNQIVNYLILHDVTLTPNSCNYVVHSKNNELIQLLEDKSVTPDNNDFTICLKESIKCHNLEMTDYIKDMKMEQNETTQETCITQAIESHNYHFIPIDYEKLAEKPIYRILFVKCRYYELFSTFLAIRVGPGILCSCLDAKQGEERITSLNCVVENHDVEMLKILMNSETYNAYGKSITIVNTKTDDDKTTYTYSKTALYAAIENKYYDIVELLLSNKNRNPDEESEIKLQRDGHLENDNYTYVKYPIHIAIENHDDRMLELLLSLDDIDINIQYTIKKDNSRPFYFNQKSVEKKTALHLAVETNNINAIRLLLSSKHKINVNKYLSFKLVKELDGFEYDEDNQGIEEEEYKEDNERDKDQRIKMTALHMAVEKGNLKMVKLLLTNGKIDVNARKIFKFKKQLLNIKYQKTPLQIAIEKQFVDIVKLLLEQPSISINERTPYLFDRTPRTQQVYDDLGAHEIKEGTIRHDDCLKTPLHVAVQTGCIDIIKLLLQIRFIDVNIPDGNNKLAIDYTDNPEIKALFPK